MQSPDRNIPPERFIRESILRISHRSGHGHIPTCFSIIEILCALYETMRHDPKRPDWSERDLFVLSKGHAALGLYCTLAYYDYFPISDVFSFGKFGSNFGCHADRLKVPGIEASTGSLGHGIGIAVGMAPRTENIRHHQKGFRPCGGRRSQRGHSLGGCYGRCQSPPRQPHNHIRRQPFP